MTIARKSLTLRFRLRLMTASQLLVALGIACGLPDHCFGQARQWSLDDCVNYALDNNISLKKNLLSLQSATEDRLQSEAALLPSLSFGTNHSMGYRPWTNSGVSTVANGMVSSGAKTTYYNGSYTVSANWTVWNGNKNHNQVKMNRLSEQEAVLDSAVTANSIQEQIAQLYVQALYLKEAVGVAQNSLEVSRTNENRGETFVEVGKMSRADLAQLAAQRSQDEYSVVEAQSALTTCLVKLKQVLELPGETEFDVVDGKRADDQALEAIPALADVYNAALASRPEIRRSRVAIESSELQERIAKAGKLPTIGITGGAGTSTNSMSNNGWGTQIKTNLDLQLGLSLQIPIFDQRQTKTAVNKARIQQQQAQLDLMDQQKTLYSTVENYWEQALTNQEKFKAAQSSVASMQASFDLLEEQFALGLKNIVELMTGKANLLQAQQNMLQSKYTTILNIQMLKFYQKSL